MVDRYGLKVFIFQWLCFVLMFMWHSYCNKDGPVCGTKYCAGEGGRDTEIICGF